MLTSKQRAALRAMGNPLETIFQIGKGGITDETAKQIANALEGTRTDQSARTGKQRLYRARGGGCARRGNRRGRGCRLRHTFPAVPRIRA